MPLNSGCLIGCWKSPEIDLLSCQSIPLMWMQSLRNWSITSKTDFVLCNCNRCKWPQQTHIAWADGTESIVRENSLVYLRVWPHLKRFWSTCSGGWPQFKGPVLFTLFMGTSILHLQFHLTFAFLFNSSSSDQILSESQQVIPDAWLRKPFSYAWALMCTAQRPT